MIWDQANMTQQVINELEVKEEVETFSKTLSDYFSLMKDAIENRTEEIPSMLDFYPLEFAHLASRAFAGANLQGGFAIASAIDTANRIAAFNREAAMRFKSRQDYYNDAVNEFAAEASYIDRITTRNEIYSRGLATNQNQ